MNSKSQTNAASFGRQAPLPGALAEYAEQNPVVLEEEPFDPERTYYDLAPFMEKNDEEDVQFICEVKVNDDPEDQEEIYCKDTEDDSTSSSTDVENGTEVEELNKNNNAILIDLTNGK